MLFPKWARFALGLLVAVLAYLVAGELHISEELRGAISALTLLLASAGVVPPTALDLPNLSAGVRFALVACVTVLGYVINIMGLDPTLRGVLVALVALAGSLGIVPPQAKRIVPESVPVAPVRPASTL